MSDQASGYKENDWRCQPTTATVLPVASRGLLHSRSEQWAPMGHAWASQTSHSVISVEKDAGLHVPPCLATASKDLDLIS